MQGVPSNPRSPKVQVVTTDQDVAERVGCLWGVKPSATKTRKAHWKQAYYIALRGGAAVSLMLSLKPLMSFRRQEQITNALACYDPLMPSYGTGNRKLTDAQVLDVRKRFKGGQRRADIARKLAVHPSTVGRIISGERWKNV